MAPLLERSFIDAIERAGGDANLLRTFVEAALAKTPRERTASGVISTGFAVEELLSEARSMAKRSGAPIPSIRQLCLALAGRDEAIAYWCSGGIEASDFVHAVHLPEQESIRARSLLR